MKDASRKKKKRQKSSASRQGSIRARISETISDTLRRAGGRRKKTSMVRSDIPTFLFVNKPHFSSNESLSGSYVIPREMPPPARARSRGVSEPREVKMHQRAYWTLSRQSAHCVEGLCVVQ